MKENRHAYLIMAHHRFDILSELLSDIDDERNDIFLHVDRKAKKYDPVKIKTVVKRAKLYLTDRMDIHWGGYSQIECIMMLLKTATSHGYHSYYHFMVGVEFPLKSQDYIYKFFESHPGFEFIGFDNYDNRYIERIRYYHPFNEFARNNSLYQKILNKVRILCVLIQKKLGVNLVYKYNIEFKKGNANWSITHDLALYIVSQEKLIQRLYHHSFCGDEIFIHTLVYNSNYIKRVYDINDEYHSSMRMVTWDNEFNQYHLKDLEYLLASGRLFARKIDGYDALDLISKIKEYRE